MIQSVNCDHKDFIKLCEQLELEHQNVVKEQRSPSANCLNHLDKFTTVFIMYIDSIPVGCIAMKNKINHFIEVGRLYVLPEYRKKGIATNLLKKVEEKALESGADKIRLDTYQRFTEALSLYKKFNFYEIDNYVKNSPYSICMEKRLNLSI